MLCEAGKKGVIVTEGITPPHAAGRVGADVKPGFLRRTLPVAAFPSNKTDVAMERIAAILMSAENRKNVIETNLESTNLLIHPVMSLLNVGFYDCRMAAGRKADFYGTGNTKSAGLLAELMKAICAAYGTRYRSVLEHIHILYGGEGANVHEAVTQSDFYRGVGDLPADIWRSWMGKRPTPCPFTACRTGGARRHASRTASRLRRHCRCVVRHQFLGVRPDAQASRSRQPQRFGNQRVRAKKPRPLRGVPLLHQFATPILHLLLSSVSELPDSRSSLDAITNILSATGSAP